MKTFAYKGLNRDGKKIKGTTVADTIEEAKQALINNEVKVQKIKERKENFLNKSYGSVKFKDKIIFLKYLSTVLKSGLTIKKSMDILSARVKNKYFAKILNEIRDSIENGQAFHESLKRYPGVFSPLFVNMIAVGEVSGNLPTVIIYLQDLLERSYKFRKTIKGAMAYPLVVFGLVVSVTIGLVKFVVPKISGIFDNFDVDLPFLTQLVIDMERYITKYWLLMLLGFIGFVVLYVVLMKVRSIRKSRDVMFLKIPFIGGLIKQIQIATFTQTSSTLITSGLGVVESITITADTIENLVYQDLFKEAAKYVETGGDFSNFLDLHPKEFEPMVSQMIKLGETTGSVDEIMKVLSQLYEEEVNTKIKLISNLLGPIMLILMGLFVGGIAISIITPIYQLPTLIQGK